MSVKHLHNITTKILLELGSLKTTAAAAADNVSRIQLTKGCLSGEGKATSKQATGSSQLNLY